MRVCTFGLWHLGSVISACLADAGHDVIGLDFDSTTIAGLSRAEPPLFEPGLADLVRRGMERGKLKFTTDRREALRDADVLWVAYDTPVDEDDRADVDFVVTRLESLFEDLPDNVLVVVSSQLPIGSTRRLEKSYGKRKRKERVSFACSPENLRLGKAIEVFTNPDRVVAGVRLEADREKFAALMKPITTKIEWMSVESAEMTKHALNAFLATSVTFINEIAVICERVGADAKEVERGLKSDVRIGPRAYLSPGGAFAGGTLARDIAFLTNVGVPVPLLASVKTSNDAHKQWIRNTLRTTLPSLRGKTVAVWGLTYKPGTDTLRRSASVELCRWLLSEGAVVRAHDPAVKKLPSDLADVKLCASAEEAAQGAAALVVATEWPDYRSAPASIADGVIVIDANRFLAASFGSRPGVRYYTVGKASS